MSFTTIIEAEKEADACISTATVAAEKSVADALDEQVKTLTQVKTQGNEKMQSDFATFESKLADEIVKEKEKSEIELKKFEQSMSAQKDTIVKKILGQFK